MNSKTKLLISAAISLPVSLGLWFLFFNFLPTGYGLVSSYTRFIFALNWIGISVLITFFLAIEAVAHERFFTSAINPLLGAETPRFKINLRYLQNTLEQLLLFIPGLLLLSQYLDDEKAMNAVSATALIWILTRIAFWIGYHQGLEWRAMGMIGYIQSIVVLLYVATRFLDDLVGGFGSLLLFAILIGAETYMVWRFKKYPST